MKRKLAFLLLTFLFGLQCMVAQNIRVTGVVVSEEDGEPVIGASIVVKGTTQGTITNYDGEFNLEVDRNARLQVSYVGMISQELAAQANMRIVMISDSQALDEVIVIGYGTAKRSSFTGSATVVDAKKIEKRPITNVASALEGNTPGVQVTSGMGQPGSTPEIRIRGFGSMNASSEPLYVVDGAVYNASIADLNPADIESMTVLKDANSTAIYGASAGNGIVMITTKKGSGTDGSTGVNLNVRQGFSQRAYADYDRVNVYEYYPLQWEMMKNAHITSGKDASEAAALATANIGSTLKYNPFVGVTDDAIVGVDGRLNPSAKALKWGDDLDWEDAAYGTGYRQEYTVSYNTKTAKSDTYASVGYLDDSGYMAKTNFERYTGRINYNIYPVKWMKTGLNLAMTRVMSDYSPTDDADNSSSYNNLVRYTRGMAPIYPVHSHDKETGAYLDANGNPTTDPSKYVYDYKGDRLSDPGRDALAETEFNTREFARTSQNARTYMTITPLEGLNMTLNYSLDNMDYRQKIYENPWVGDGTAGPGRLNITSIRRLVQTLNQIVNYSKKFGDHSFDAMVGHENYSYKYEYLYGMKTEESINGIYEFGNFVTVANLNSYTNTYNKESYFGRLNYDYANKYYGSVIFRRDGSSRFHKDSRWGNFWSFGASWRLSEEDFMKEYTWINNLKLRASYGETGNDMILDSDGYTDYYPYQTLYGLGYKNWNEAGVYFTSIANSKLKWETQVSTDVAIEFGLFDRLTGTIEYFDKRSRDLLFSVSQPTSSGVSSIAQNIGKVSNSGIEVDLHYNAFRNRDWSVNVGVNWTYTKNTIKELPEEMKENGYVNGSKKWMEGKPRYEFWLRQWYGVNPANGDGLYLLDTEKYTGDAITAAVQKTIVEIDGKQLTNSYTYAKYDFAGDAAPKFIGGFNFDVSYKGFDLGAVFSYQLGGKMLDTSYAGLMSGTSYGSAMASDIKESWKQPGDITDVPRLDNNATHNTNIGQSYSTRWLISSDYLNLRSVTLGWSIPRTVLSPLTLKSARLSVSAENLFMLKARQGLNPMANYAGTTSNVYNPARNITFGLNVSF
ncbi:TonB-dependent receptor [Parabacteroides sp. PF5-6]|uniref:SusC/RagA family TonB-linked outer membrane protein n=1 Tax=Parabacteroides sp. PF5-6 TaxID=1742403 RepID=UPI002405DC7A|nr:TonB-dependent receptor [Parabacteroides sp. PF5-6]